MPFRSIHTCYFASILLLTLISCKEEAFKPLSPQLMQEIIQELHYADAAAERFEGKQKPRNTLRDELYDQIMERYSISREEFYDSYYYYLEETYVLDSLYQAMIDTLQARTHELEKINAGENNYGDPAKIKSPGDSARRAAGEGVPAWRKNKPAQ